MSLAVPEQQRTHARTLLKKRLGDAPYFADAVEKLDNFVNLVEQSIFDHKKTQNSYRDQLLSIVSNIAKIKGTVHEFDPSDLGKMHVQDILDKKLKEKQEKRSAMRAQHLRDDTKIQCESCGLIRRTRLNVNLGGLDGEDLGLHFISDNFCSCGEDKVVLEVKKIESSDDDSDEPPSTLGRRVEVPATSSSE